MKNVLKKDFKEKDIQRIRNIVSGNANERTTFGVGYTKKQDFYEEGDVWEEDGKQWTIKDGLKQNITKLDNLKKEVLFPLFCPKCGHKMDQHLDKLSYMNARQCYNCHAKMERELKSEGKWEDHVNNLHNEHIEKLKSEYLMWLDQMLEASNEGIVTEDGEVQKWVGKIDITKVLESKQETLDYFDSLKK